MAGQNELDEMKLFPVGAHHCFVFLFPYNHFNNEIRHKKQPMLIISSDYCVSMIEKKHAACEFWTLSRKVDLTYQANVSGIRITMYLRARATL